MNWPTSLQRRARVIPPTLFRDYFPRTIFAEKSPKQGGVAGAALSRLVQRKKAGTFPIPPMRQAVHYLSSTTCQRPPEMPYIF
ncbi:hypothetical protein AVEN_595-1 [Araneus ventricosus]|uniref:Uncharacterized protein n=1 Tax=Araneus ventricosus TaxID=182803 RepID=A0A4Y2JSX4_ARAVE|nr:hypothetical protein AVEN_595-1 [Araneus ventricosus]